MQRESFSGHHACLLTFLLLALCLVRSAQAAPSTYEEAEQASYNARMVKQLQTQDPEAAQRFQEATEAYNAADFVRAGQLFKRVNERQPSFAPALRRRGVCAARLGRHAEGIELARQAVQLDQSVESNSTLGILLIEGTASRTPTFNDLREAHGIAKANLERIPSDLRSNMLWCQSALSLKWAEDFQACAEHFVRQVPKAATAHVFAALAAAMRGDLGAAHAAHRRARALGLSAAQDVRLVNVLSQSEPAWSRLGPLALGLGVGWLVGLAVLFGLGSLLSLATLRMVRALPRDERTPQGRTLRAVYRAVLHLAGIYYYLSLPLILLVVTSAGGAFILFFIYLGKVPIKLVLIIAALVLCTIAAVIQSLLVRIKDTDPGQPLDLKENPKLAQLLTEVAARVGTRPVDRVYMTAEADVAVLERGGLRGQLRGHTERCLVLGAAVLDGMKRMELRAILAHEYGHFASRDTAGGGFALAVRRSLLLTAMALAESGAAGWYNPAWWFLNGFHRIFLRISQGASRLQEVMADRTAVFCYGAEAFASGLRHIVRRSIAFDAHVGATLKEVLSQARPLANLYEYTPSERPLDTEIEQAIQDALQAEPSPYDSHPRPADRIAWVSELVVSAPSQEDDSLDAWSLFADKLALQRQLTRAVCGSVAAITGVEIKERAIEPEPDA